MIYMLNTVYDEYTVYIYCIYILCIYIYCIYIYMYCIYVHHIPIYSDEWNGGYIAYTCNIHVYLPIFHIFQPQNDGFPGCFRALHPHGPRALPLRRLFGFPGGPREPFFGASGGLRDSSWGWKKTLKKKRKKWRISWIYSLEMSRNL